MDAREGLEPVDGERGLAAARLGGTPDRRDDVAEMDVHLARAVGGAEKLDAAGAVDEVEEGQLAHVAPSHHAPGETPLLRALAAGLELLGFCTHGGDRVAVGEALRGHGRRIIHARGPSSGVRPSSTTSNPRWR